MIAYDLYRRLRARRRATVEVPAAEASPPERPVARRRPQGPAGGGAEVVVAEGLVKRYGGLVAVDGVGFTVEAGEIFGVLGPNGAGKTTTLEMLEGLRDPDEGTVRVLGRPMSAAARDVKERIGVQLQATALPQFTRVDEAIDLFGAMYRRRRPTGELLEQFDLTARAGAYASDLSGGQLQRLSLALALVNDPELVFLDEPTTGLDPAARLALWSVIDGIRGQGRTVLLTTHYMEEAERLCDRVAVMDSGRIVALDTPARLISRHAPGSRIAFDLPVEVDSGTFSSLAGVDRAEVEGQHVVLTTTRPETVLAQLFDPATLPAARAADAHGGVTMAAPALRDLRVHSGTLEDVFLTLTGRRLRES